MSATDLTALLPLLTPENGTRVCFCTDDRQPSDLLDQGSIDYLVRQAISGGVDPVLAIRAATINPATYFRLNDRDAVAPGRKADLVVFSDLKAPRAEMVFREGTLVAQNGKLLPWERPVKSTKARGSINVNWEKINFAIPAKGDQIKVIGMIPNQLVTEALVEKASISGGYVVADPERDLIKFAVIERHYGTGKMGLGFLKGLGIKRGALASTVAHDHHNIVVAGADDESMFTAVRTIAAMQGGMAVAQGDKVLAQLALPIAGLMSDQPIEVVREQYDHLVAAARHLGSPLHDPMMGIGFMALSVIPSLKLTDMGLVDVDAFELTSLFP